MQFKIHQNYSASERRLATIILWFVGNPVPYECHKRIITVVTIYSACICLLQIVMLFLNSWGILYYYCCHPVADMALLLRLLHPNIIQFTAFIYQVIFILNASKLKKFYKELDRVIPSRIHSIRSWRSMIKSFSLVVFSLSYLYFARMSSCGLQDHYRRIYNKGPGYCSMIYVIPEVPTMISIFFTGLYTKLILQIATIALSVIGITFTEFWIGNILHTLTIAFDESHNSLIPILEKEIKLKEERSKLYAKPSQLSCTLKFGKSFQVWRKQQYQLRLITKRADSLLSPFALLHSIFTPILLCLAGLSLLKKNQEPFMKFLEIKLVSYYLICLCLVRMWILCNAGDQLAKQVKNFIS